MPRRLPPCPGETTVIDEVRRVLDHLISQYVVREEIRTIDRDASVVPDGQSIEQDKQQAVQREQDHARALGESFNDGLVHAWRRFRRGGIELSLDDRDPTANALADALIQFLVRFDLASSRTEETEPLHYTYYITVDWDRLFIVADEASVNLRAALDRHTAGAAS